MNFNTNFYLNHPVLFRPELWDLNIYPEDLYHRYIVVLRIQLKWTLTLDSRDYDIPTI